MGYIYKITNSINGKIYVGQTFRDVQERFKEHLRMGRKDKVGYKSLLYYAIKKYGKDAFSVDTLEECPDELLNDREAYWIKTLDTQKQGYNISLAVQKGSKYRISDIATLWEEGYCAKEIAKTVGISKQIVLDRLHDCGITSKDIMSRGNTKGNIKRRKIVRVSADGTTKIYNSVTEASRENNILTSGICAVCRGDRNFAGGYRWAYYEGEETLKDIKPISITHCIKEVHQYTKDGQYIRSFSSLSDARKFMSKTTINTIMIACRDITRTAYGYRWSYEKQDILKLS